MLFSKMLSPKMLSPKVKSLPVSVALAMVSVPLPLLTLISPAALAEQERSPLLNEVLVTADFRESAELDYAASLTVVGSQQIQGRAAQHLDEVLNVAPNVNISAGASRGRYIQIRGIGERSQFVDPINPSVGLMIDGVNLSGVGNVSTLFDIEQVEVLRGPQGTRFGASALAGMVNIQAKAPTQHTEGLVTVGIGNANTWQTGAVISGALSEQLLGRLALEHYDSDGFIENRYLGRDDTAKRDETTARLKLNWQASDNLIIDTSLFYIDVDNGYDGFSLDNNRNTLTDEPGRDSQETLALALSSQWQVSSAFRLESTVAVEQTDVEYGYDEDWTNTQICDNLACDSSLWGFDWWYSSTDNYLRERESVQIDVRLVSEEDGKLFDTVSWVAGIYAIDQQEDLKRDFFNWDIYAPDVFINNYDSQRVAVYGELAVPLSDKLALTVGARVEDFSADYSDSRGVAASPSETLWGGEISLEYQAGENTLVYGLLSRGYKAGGVNGEAVGKAEENNFEPSVIAFLEQRITFDTETALNLEVGVKGSYLQDRLQLRLAVFTMDRDDVQLKGWYNEGPVFVGYTDNAASGENSGAEIEVNMAVSNRLSLFAAVGVLDTEIQDFYIRSGDGLANQSGRDQAHAPEYQFNIGATLQVNEQLSGRIEVDGRDSFYYSDSHEQQSEAYELIHASIHYQVGNVAVKLWGRNLADEDYGVRGFYFANDPREFYEDDQAYVQLGDPRSYGVKLSYQF